MLDLKLIHIIEKMGVFHKDGKKLYGTAALLHFLSMPASNISAHTIKKGEKFVCDYLRKNAKASEI